MVVLSVPLSSSPTASPTVTAAAEIRKLREQWIQSLRSKQLDLIVSMYAPDADFLPPTEVRVTGESAIRDLFSKIMGSVNGGLALHSIATESSGNLAYDSGEYKETLVYIAHGRKAELQGNYVMVLKRQADGKWRVVQHVWTEVTPNAH